MSNNQSSPEFVRLSQAAAMTLDLMGGSFYRDAKLYCINLLLTYPEGCAANCSYCGLQANREGEYEKKSFIRVTWPVHSIDEIIEKIVEKENTAVKRVCISMVTRRRSVEDTIEIAKKIRNVCDVPISGLVSPTIMFESDFPKLKEAGIDKVGIAIDTASEELFVKHRGKSVGGPHSWQKYWDLFEAALRTFGRGNVGSHYVVGLGETEKEMISAIQKIKDMGGETHLFSFFPEPNSALRNHPRPTIPTYRRIQLARYMIDAGVTHITKMRFDDHERVLDFGADTEEFVESGRPFMTSGCVGKDGEVACNRPFANERPSEEFRNFPFTPTADEITEIRKELATYTYE